VAQATSMGIQPQNSLNVLQTAPTL